MLKKKKFSIKQYKQFSNSLALLTHLPLFRVELKILLPICLWPQSILAVQRTGAPGTGLQQNWDHSLSHDECVCCIGAQSHGVCVCVCVLHWCSVLKWKASQSVKLSRWMLSPLLFRFLPADSGAHGHLLQLFGFALLMQSVFSLVWMTFANVHPSLQLDENSFHKVWEKQACKDLLSTA